MNASPTLYPSNAAASIGLPSVLSPRLTAAIELTVYLAIAAAATVSFLLDGLTCNQAAILTVLWLLSLTTLAWGRFDGGRHPCFFFLCTLTLFQAGQLIAYCAGGAEHIFRITVLTPHPFDVSRNVTGLVLLSIALSSICIYAPCRWNYHFICPPSSKSLSRFLPYLYFLLFLSVPVQLFKNFRYYEYAKDHGGYLVFFTDHGGLASSVSLPVRTISLICLPALVGILVLERRAKVLGLAAASYFMVEAPILLTGSRGAVFSLILSLWYLAGVKSSRRSRLYSVGLFGVAFVLIGSFIGSFRIGNAEFGVVDNASQFIAGQGVSINVTEIAVAYRARFTSNILCNLAGELQSAFVASDQTNYVAGQHFADDVSMFLNPTNYRLGVGSGSAYLAEAYVLGGLTGVALLSGLLGTLLHGMHVCAQDAFGLFLVAMILPEVLLMPRGGLLDWVSASMRVGISVVLLLAGWYLYRGLARIGCILWQGTYGQKYNTVKLQTRVSGCKA